ncbi:MAG TPA: FUSC family protein [Pseudonocardiaceae bacterium]|nr:FUSC family protein [Pseudonocardiaceae bacterium]
MQRHGALAELRTMLSGADPGMVRLRLAGIGTASMMLAAAIGSGARWLSGQPVTVVLVAAMLAMISNFAVNEPDLPRLRVTTLLMLVPALASLTGGALLASHHLIADLVFVAVTTVAIYIRRFGTRGSALGMAAFQPFFLAQYLHVTVEQLPWLLVAATIGIGSTLLLRGWAFAERPERTRERLIRAFRARLHALVEEVADLLRAAPQAVEDTLYDVERQRARLNEAALLLGENLERNAADPAEGSPRPGQGPREGPDEGADQGPEESGREGRELLLAFLDAELAAERLAVAAEQLVQHESLMDERNRRALLAGVDRLGAASATGILPGSVHGLLDGAKRSIWALATETVGQNDRAQRVAFAAIRLADALATVLGIDGAAPARDHELARPPMDQPADGRVPATESGGPDGPASSESGIDEGAAPGTDAQRPQGLALSTRQALQVGIAASLAIVIGELVSPARWYWAVLTAFIVFVNTSSRGDVLSRGWQRLVGTIGGVLAGMGLAVLVSGHELAALLVLFGCAFLALYLARVSQTLFALWITAVLAVLYGLIGQFSVQTLVLRIEETAVGVAMGMLAAYLVVPKRTREVFGETLDEMVATADAALAGSVERILGREPAYPLAQLTRDLHQALRTLRERGRPLDNPLPWRRGRSSYQRTLRMLTGVEYYVRRLARVADEIREPGWAPTLRPAAARVRANLDALRQLLQHHPTEQIASAQDLVDAAEAYAAHIPDPDRRVTLLNAIRLLRRIDQIVVKFATDLGGVDATTQPQSLPTNA